MGAPKQKWTSEEEDALRAGIEKHGPGKWRTIQTDPDFSTLLANRSNIDLKDKWRNLSVSACSLVGSGCRDKAVKSPKLKALPAPSAATPAPVFSAPIDIRPLAITFPVKKQQEAPCSKPLNKPLAISFPVKKQQQEGPSRYHSLILEALSTLRDPNGIDISAIHHFIEQKQEVGPNFRKTLSSKLKDLLGKDKIEKVSNGYRLKDPSFVTKTPTPRHMDSSLRTQPNRVVQAATFQSDYATKVAQIVAVADDKSRKADEAVQEAEKVSRMAEENDSLLQHVKGLFERCLHGEIIPLA